MQDESRLVMVTVTGPDTPGITTSLTKILADAKTPLRDIDQVVIQGQLILCLLVEFNGSRSEGRSVLKDLLFEAKNMGLDLQFKLLDSQHSDDRVQEIHRYALTLLGDHSSARSIQLVSSVLADRGANIEGIRQLSKGAFSSVEVVFSLLGTLTEGSKMKMALLNAVAGKGIDLALQRETISRRSKRLVIMDMDSTLIRIEVIDELARMHGVMEQVSHITERAMAGELEFDGSLRERVALLKGLEMEKVEQLAADLPLTEGAESMLRVLQTLGFKTGVISGGFTFAVNALKKRLNLDYAYANELEVIDGKLTGNVIDPVITPQRKADLLETIAQGQGISLEQTIAIGDGANDAAMIRKAGLGIAFHAKAKLREAADTAISQGGLDRILYFLGLNDLEVRQALRENQS